MQFFVDDLVAGLAMLFYIELRNGKTIPFFFGKSKRNEELVEKLKRNAGRYGFKVDSTGNY